MSICKLCGAEIEWIYTQEKQYRPVDPCPVFVIEGEGTDRFIEDEGAIITGREARPDEEHPCLPVAFVPHRRTCGRGRDRKGG